LSATYAGNLWANNRNYRNQSDFTGFLQSLIDLGINKLPSNQGLWQQPDVGDPAPGNGKTIYIRAENAAGSPTVFVKQDAQGLDWSDVAAFIRGTSPRAADSV
jgi:hypothetical protein